MKKLILISTKDQEFLCRFNYNMLEEKVKAIYKLWQIGESLQTMRNKSMMEPILDYLLQVSFKEQVKKLKNKNIKRQKVC